MNFMRLITQGPGHAFYNMALDEAISEAVRQKLSPPTLRFYRWDRPSLSLGYFQKVSDIDIDYCNKKGYPVVRRQTGGRAVLHDSELTYSFSAPADSQLFKGSLLDNFTVISNAMILGLELNGIKAKASFSRTRNPGYKNPACFKAVSFGEITVNGRKIIGSAQKRYKDGFLQHGSILLSFNAEELGKALGQNSGNNFSDIGAINDYAPELSYSGLCNTLKKAFEKTMNVKMISNEPAKFEQDLAKKLESNKYSTREWNYRR
ncbi:MAG: lipoate--protein ligase family protein [Nitrospirae bacterium]|nr:lipoate--protein ligase family protein [Nitrospirota bacterium]